MANKPRWLSTVAAGMIVALVLLACTPAAGPTTPPATAAPPATTAPVTAAPATATAAAPTEATPTEATPTEEAPTAEAPTEEPPTAAPATAYPTPVEQPTDPAAITTTFPNYGGEIDCAAGSWNGLPYTGNLKSITAPTPQQVVFTFCNPDVAFLSKIAFSVFAINDSDWLIAHVPDGSALETLNGTGPFKLDAWTRGSELDYSRFDNYWGETAVPATGVLQFSGRVSRPPAGPSGRHD